MSQISDFVDHLNSAGVHEDVLHHQDAFERFASTLDVEGALCSELETCLQDFRHAPRVRVGLSTTLFRGGWFELSLVDVNQPAFPVEITTEAANAVYHFLSQVSLRMYEILNSEPVGYSMSSRIRLVDEFSCDPGTTIGIDSTKQVFAIASPTPASMLTLANARRHIFSCDFRVNEGSPTSLPVTRGAPG